MMIPNYNTEDTRWKDAFVCLLDAGFEVYSPGQHTGDCKSKYVVIRFAGSMQKLQLSTKQVQYELLCYVPVLRYAEMEEFCASVKLAMKALYPMFVDLDEDLPDFLDEDIKGHMRTLKYRVYEKIER